MIYELKVAYFSFISFGCTFIFKKKEFNKVKNGKMHSCLKKDYDVFTDTVTTAIHTIILSEVSPNSLIIIP